MDRSSTKKAKFNISSKKLKNEIFKFDIDKEKKVIESGSAREYFKYVKRKTICREVIPPLSKENNEYAYSDLEKASILNNYFCSVFTKDNYVLPDFSVSKVENNNLCLNNIYFSDYIVAQKIGKIKNSCSPGYDGFTATPLKKMKNFIAKPLSMLFSISMASGVLPSIWKKAIIIPIFKKGDKSNSANYRPISLTSIICKIMESIIKDNILSYLNRNDLIYSKQYGFMPKKSTNAQLLTYFNDISSHLLNGCQVDSIYLDYSKAFDSIVHGKLLYKLEKYGITGNLLVWLASFLVDRQQMVKVNYSYSDWSTVLSGVPSGSVLGPILFLIYIDDLSNCSPDLKSLYLFADDAKCFSVIKSSHDCMIFQNSLVDISNWSNLWQLNLSPDKCQVISFTHHQNSFVFNYSVNSIPLLRVNNVVDLGINFSQNLSFSPHIKDTCNKARRKASIILNCFKSKNKVILYKAFTTFVRPILEYCSNLWNPFRKSEIALVESVQKRFTKRLDGLSDLQYFERLEVLKAETLEQRRLKSDLSMYYKIIHEMVDLPVEEFFSIRNGVTRNNGASLYKNKFRSNAERYYFQNRCINAWNALPTNVANAASPLVFKKCLASIDLRKFLRS